MSKLSSPREQFATIDGILLSKREIPGPTPSYTVPVKDNDDYFYHYGSTAVHWSLETFFSFLNLCSR
jgi:hypothetical protein